MKKRKTPKWLLIHAQIDYLMWELGRIYDQVRSRTTIEQMIDKATCSAR